MFSLVCEIISQTKIREIRVFLYQILDRSVYCVTN